MTNFKFFLAILTAVLLFNITEAQNTRIASLLEQVSVDSIKAHVQTLSEAGGYNSRVTYTEGNEFSARFLQNYFNGLPGISDARIDSFTIYSAAKPYDTIPVFNIIVTFAGNGADEEIILCGAHYDASASHESNWKSSWQSVKARGADDNATGVAAVMEIARIISDPLNNLSFRRTIKFVAFGAEEYHPVNPSVHHAGSLWDADRTKKQNQKLIGALILDMIGYNPNKDYCEVISNTASLWMTDYVYRNRDAYVSDLVMNNVPADVPYSDHQSYQDFGFSAILLMENDRPWNDDYPNYSQNPYYHSEADAPGTLNYLQVKKVTQLALATIVELAQPDTTTLISKQPNQLTVENFNLNAYPNPFNGEISISFNAG
ncbi:MAG: M20/M25/M40 family metallo-hydrolase, partial [Calditrichaeota bacterium]|nr:M20/M25/M40 family metallo-hydrolase [Calditrichota bacterium]